MAIIETHTNPLKIQYFDLRPMLTTREVVLEYSTLTKVVSNIKETFVETIPNIMFP
jgi:hypothetical protein